MLSLFILVEAAESAVPQVINYRGRLVDASGAPVADGANFLRFVIYASATGGPELWNSGIQQVATHGGLFNYELGSNTPLPAGLFFGAPTRYLGITVGADPEIAPRTKFTSSAFSMKALSSDSASIAQNAGRLNGQIPSYYLAWNNLTGIPAGFADGVDNNAGGDITEVSVGSGLIGGGVTGPVEVGIAGGGVTSFHIAANAVGQNAIAPGAVGASEVANNSLTDADISASAAISVLKISGGAINATSTQTITGVKTFTNLKILSTVRRIALSSFAFDASYNVSVMRGWHGRTFSEGLGSVELLAPVSFPDGAIIVQLERSFVDSHGSEDATLNLIRRNQSTGSIVGVAQISTSGSPGLTTVTSPTLGIVVDNELYCYFLDVVWLNSGSTGDLQLAGAEIEYTITKPLP